MRNRILKVAILVLAITTLLIGCTKSNEGSDNMDNNSNEYVSYALGELNSKYNEEFKLKQVGGTFGGTRDTYKLVCYPINNEEEYFEVEVEKDLSKIYDEYTSVIMEKKASEKVQSLIANELGNEVIVKAKMNTQQSTASYNLDIEEYLKENTAYIVFDVFIKGKPDSEAAEKIYKVMGNIYNSGIKTDYTGVFIYVKEDSFNNVEAKYDELKDTDGMYKYFYGKDVSYASTGCEYIAKDKSVKESVEEIKSIL